MRAFGRKRTWIAIAVLAAGTAIGVTLWLRAGWRRADAAICRGRQMSYFMRVTDYFQGGNEKVREFRARGDSPLVALTRAYSLPA